MVGRDSGARTHNRGVAKAAWLWSRSWAEIRRGYDRRSAITLVVFIVIAASIGYHWSDLLDANGEMDWLLAGIWVWLTAMLTRHVSPRRDLLLVITGLAGGGVIEWWGTTTGLWSYFTLERPPLWILPAWPIAALSIDRMGQELDRGLAAVYGRRSPRRALRAFRFGYWLIMPLFVVGMVSFLAPSLDKTSSQVVVVLMLVVTLHSPDPRRDLVLFFAGSFMGIFLEYWGTSRQCWTYYTHEIPPPIAIVAHGFAAVAFARAAGLADQLSSALFRRPLSQRQSRNAAW